MDRPELDARFSHPDVAATPWESARAVLEHADVSWISTVRDDGRPHVTPLVCVWLDDTAFFTTGEIEQKAVNLARNPNVCITTGTGTWQSGLDVVVEGRARRITDDETLRRLAAAWAARWDGRWVYEVVDGGFVGHGIRSMVFAVEPSKVLAFGKGRFSQTRYRFDG